MKWIVIASFMVYLVAFSEGSVLRCSRGTDNDCLPDNKKESGSNVGSKKAVCLAGSEWQSSCHRCRCSDDGQPQCERIDSCKHEIYEEPMVCRPLSEFRRDCNICICLKNGRGSSCTSIECTPEVPKVLPEGKECQVGSSWQSQCNNCTCWDGMPSCTDMACPGHEDEPELMCDPGTSWKIECNTCNCPPTGQAVCTRIGCGLHPVYDFNPGGNDDDDLPKPETYSNNRVKRSRVCKPNTIYKVDCNSCKCASDAQSYSCTLNECMEDSDFSADIGEDVEVFIEKESKDVEQVCKPRRTFRIGCNTCLCTVDGTDFSCTNKPCPLPDDVEIFKELKILRTAVTNKSVVCAANRMFIKDCNTCWCNEDGTSYYCTRRVCVGEVPEETQDEPENLQEIKRKCRPDEVFEMDCNMCRCSVDGMSFSCTRRACVPEDDVKDPVSLARKIRATSQGTLKACQPGQEFRMDCNKCLCNNEGQDYSCTRINCAALNSNGNSGARAKREVATQVKADCVPGGVFKQGCNTCQCTPDGNHATCTIKRCKEDNPDDLDENELNLPESDPSFRCNPGEQFKRGCNDCACSADGKSVFCALRLCDQDITPTI